MASSSSLPESNDTILFHAAVAIHAVASSKSLKGITLHIRKVLENCGVTSDEMLNKIFAVAKDAPTTTHAMAEFTEVPEEKRKNFRQLMNAAIAWTDLSSEMSK